MPFHIPYGKQEITEDDIAAVTSTLTSDFLTQGPKIQEFESNFCTYTNAKYAVAVSNGTAALHLSVLALDLMPGDKVITTPITFAASANAIRYAGAEVIFADIDPDTFLMDLNHVESLLKNDPTIKGVIPVDFGGLPVNTEELKSITNKYNCWVVEDACHSPGGAFIDTNNSNEFCGSGNYSSTTVFSFHPVKHIAAGEGGMITTNDEKIYEKLISLRTHGITKNNLIKNIEHPDLQGSWYYEQQELGYNYRLTDIQSALGNSQLKRAKEGVDKRNEIANIYKSNFDKYGISYQKTPAGYTHAYHLFIILSQHRKELYEFLRKHNIYSQVHYIPVHLMPYYQKLGWKKGDLPKAEEYYNRCLSLPMFPSLTQEEQSFVIEKVIEFTV